MLDHTKKKAPTMHIRIGDDLSAILAPFAANRGLSKNAVICYALAKLFEEEAVEPAREIAAGSAIKRVFAIPTGYKLRSFILTLYMLAKVYPSASSQKFWGKMVYLLSDNKTHEEVWSEIEKQMTSGK